MMEFIVGLLIGAAMGHVNGKAQLIAARDQHAYCQGLTKRYHATKNLDQKNELLWMMDEGQCQ